MNRLIPILIIFVVFDIYAFQAFRTLFKQSWVMWTYIAGSLLVLALFIYQSMNLQSVRMANASQMYIMGVVVAVYLSKFFLLAFMLGEDVVRLIVATFQRVSGASDSFHLPSRRKFVSTIALGLAAIPFTTLLIGMVRGKYNYKVLQYALEFDDLPDAFDGFTITQISDVHSGSFDNADKVSYGIDLINKQQSDIILFTGDLVNNIAEEMGPWKQYFSKLKAKDGVYSVLGNHDYGDYVSWNSEEAKKKNLEDLKNLQREMGWDLLLNENRTFERNGETIRLIGVENWGAGRFKKAGDLEKAIQGVAKDEFKILMSHDPSHWRAEVVPHPFPFHLTLSGHTHGMQYGVEIPGLFKISPVSLRYKEWAGIYKEANEFINVNRGFGFIGYPGRVGIWPEISVITLKKRRNTA
ncbi:metallophosphoesterase [Aureisphaera galaxeae]|uniref:metallophosphoesterase n=1 Tax=Aureisphaera galaxeae TaxID=1538023 RepID=UPI002350C710|nr:metallophosphoesterase [Aureisphaera galaxeae]MDC8005889.1 metallophosphoesterase [Aureisphaera galaxeae]